MPQLFAASGATAFGARRRRSTRTRSGFQPSYQAEGWVYGKYLARTRPGAKVAVLFQNDDYGKDLLGGLKQGLAAVEGQGRRGAAVRGRPPPTSQSQVAKLRSSGAEHRSPIFATPKFAIQAYVYANKLGWKPKLSIDNAVVVGLEHHAARLRGRDEQGRAEARSRSRSSRTRPTRSGRRTRRMKLYRTIMKRYAPGANVERRLPRLRHGRGVDVRRGDPRRAGKNLTREGLVKAVDSMNM